MQMKMGACFRAGSHLLRLTWFAIANLFGWKYKEYKNAYIGHFGVHGMQAP